MLQQTNFVQTNYLSRCDLVNKYNLTTVYGSPRLTHVVLEFSLPNFIRNTDFGKATADEKELQLKAFLLSFLFTGQLPIINSKKLSVIQSLNKKNELNFALKIKLSNNRDINFFLIFLFIENWNRFVKHETSFFDSTWTKSSPLTVPNKPFNVCVKCPAVTLFEFQTLFNVALTPVNLKEFNIALNFVIKPPVFQTGVRQFAFPTNAIGAEKRLNVVKNLPFFWQC